MAAPTLITSYEVDSTASNANALATTNFTPSNGEVLVIKISAENNNTPTFGSVSGGGQSYTQQANYASGSQTPARIYTAVISGSPGSMDVTMTFSGSAGWHSMVVERWSGAVVAATPATVATLSSGAPSATVTTVANDSIVSWVSADWAAVAPGTPAYRSGAIQTGLHDRSPSNYTAYYAYQSATTAGSQTIGLTSPTGQNATLVGIEIQGLSVTAPVVATNAVTDVAPTTATGNGDVTGDGGDTITERGICWGMSANPTTANSKVTAAGTTGSYSGNITGLSDGTTYHVRAYAINSVGTSYGANVSFRNYGARGAWFTA